MRSTSGATGYDLSSAEQVIILRKSRSVVKMGLAKAIPLGAYVWIALHSGLVGKWSIDVGMWDVGIVLLNTMNLRLKEW